MLSAVLKSDIAVDVSIKIMDTFVRMRNFFVSNKDMFARLDRVELKQLVYWHVEIHGNSDSDVNSFGL